MRMQNIYPLQLRPTQIQLYIYILLLAAALLQSFRGDYNLTPVNVLNLLCHSVWCIELGRSLASACIAVCVKLTLA